MKKPQAGFTLIELMIVVAIIGILAAIALPQYQLYVVKSQASRIMSETSAMKTAVEACINEGKTAVGLAANQCDPSATGSSLIVGNSQVGAVLLAGTGVPQVTINAGTNTATIQSLIGASAAAIMDTKTMTWSRDVEGSWSCTTTIPAVYRPRGCE